MGQQEGMKITTFLVLILLARKELLGLATYQFRKTYHRTRHWFNVPLGTAVIFQLTFLRGSLWSLSRDAGWSTLYLYLVFEVVSALATVGVTANVTSTLNGAGTGHHHGAHVYRTDRPFDPYGQLEQLPS